MSKKMSEKKLKIIYTISSLIIGVTVIFIAYSLVGQQSANIPAWKISYNGKEAYLVGNIPFGKGSYYPLSLKIENIYSKCTAVVVTYNEIDVIKFNQAIFKAGSNSPGLKKELSPKVYKDLLAFSQKHNCDDLVNNRLEKTWVCAMNIKNFYPVSLLDQVTIVNFLAKNIMTPDLSIQKYFLKKKSTKKKKIIEIEPIIEYLTVLDSLPPDLYALYTIDHMGLVFSQKEMYIDEMYSGKCDKLTDWYMRPLSSNPELIEIYQKLYYDRSKKFAPKILKIIKENKDTFIILDLELLLGSNSIIELLEKAGAKVEKL